MPAALWAKPKWLRRGYCRIPSLGVVGATRARFEVLARRTLRADRVGFIAVFFARPIIRDVPVLSMLRRWTHQRPHIQGPQVACNQRGIRDSVVLQVAPLGFVLWRRCSRPNQFFTQLRRLFRHLACRCPAWAYRAFELFGHKGPQQPRRIGAAGVTERLTGSTAAPGVP
jgi:hypothetical protein